MTLTGIMTFQRINIKVTARLLAFLLIGAVFFVSSNTVVFAGLSSDQKDTYQKWINYFDVATGCSASSPAPDAGSSDSVGQIARKYNLQSAMIKKVGGGVIGQYNADQPPTTPASTMKLIIVDTLLRSGKSLDDTITVSSELLYPTGNSRDLKAGEKTTLKNALILTFEISSNTGANVLMKALGGVKDFTDKAQGYGYSHTDVQGYYSPANDGINKSTISDQVDAMDHIFTADGADYKTAQEALKNAAKGDNHYNVDDNANKWAGTSTVAGNVGKFSVGGSDYIVGVYINRSSTDADAQKAVKNGSEELAQLANSGGGQPSSGGSSSCVCGTPSFGSGTLPSSVPDPYNGIFTAAGKKFNVSPALVAAIFYGGEHGNSFPDPPPPYGHGQPWASSNKGANGPFQFIPSTWATQGVDGNGDGKKDIQDLTDGAFGAANYLYNSEARGDDTSTFHDAIFAYNHAEWYVDNVMAAYQKFSTGGSPSAPSDGGTQPASEGCSSGSPDCQSATGTAKILCESKKYDPVNYVWGGGHGGGKAYHDACPEPKAQDASENDGEYHCGLDCSGLVSVAVYDAFGNNSAWDTTVITSDKSNWKEVSESELQSGDLIEPNIDHVEIVDHVSGDTIYTFGAHTASYPQPKQVGSASFSKKSTNKYYRYVGQGV